MIGTDTNILLRYFLRDDAEQYADVDAFLGRAEKAGEPVFIPVIALCETIWYLRSRVKWPRVDLANGIQQLLSANLFLLENEDLVAAALRQFREGKADFQDYLIGQVNRSKGCRHTVTFDRALLSEAGFVPPSKR